MPIYEYQCQACHKKVEVMQNVTDPVLTDCEACGKPELTRLISSTSFQLKGSGWYVTDFKGNGKKPAQDTKPAEAGDTAAKTDTTSKDSTSDTGT